MSSSIGSTKGWFICCVYACSVLSVQGVLELNVSKEGVIFTETDKAKVTSTRQV